MFIPASGIHVEVRAEGLTNSCKLIRYIISLVYHKKPPFKLKKAEALVYTLKLKPPISMGLCSFLLLYVKK